MDLPKIVSKTPVKNKDQKIQSMLGVLAVFPLRTRIVMEVIRAPDLNL